MADWDFGVKTFTAPKKSDYSKLLCRMCKQPLGTKPYVMAVKQGTGPWDEKKDMARVHEECVPDG